MAAGWLVRLWHWQNISGTAFADFARHATGLDQHFFWEWAERMAVEGDWLGQNTYYPHDRDPDDDTEKWYHQLSQPKVFTWEPLYPYFFAASSTRPLKPPFG